jgi:hypothetical protein
MQVVKWGESFRFKISDFALCLVLCTSDLECYALPLRLFFASEASTKNKAPRTKHQEQSTKNKAQRTKHKEQSTKLNLKP